MKLSEAVELYIGLRDKKAQMKADFEATVKPVQEKMDKLDGLLLGAFDRQGVDSCKTEHGTAYISTRSTASVADKDAFMEYVKKNVAWDYLETRVNKAAVESHMQEFGDAPPGVNVRTERVVNIRRS